MKNVAVVQLRSTQDVRSNLQEIARYVREAAEAGADFVALPENCCFLRTEPGAAAPVQSLEGELMGELRALAGEAGVWLLVGSFPEASADPRRYHNTSVVIDGTAPGAPLTAAYRKLHLFDIDIPGSESQRESDSIAAGDRVVTTDIGGTRTGLSICYDLRFPRLYQAMVDEGALVVTVPAAFTEYTGKDHWLILLRARAIETQTFVVAPGQVGWHGGKRRSFGKSAIIDPWGIPLAIAPDRPGWAMARLDFDHQAEIRQSLPCAQHRSPVLR